MTDYLCEVCGKLASQHATEIQHPTARVRIGKQDGACSRSADSVNARAYVPEPDPPPPPMPEPVE